MQVPIRIAGIFIFHDIVSVNRLASGVKVINIEGAGGITISDRALAMLNIWYDEHVKEKRVEVRSKFNGIRIKVSSETTVSEIVQQYERGLKDKAQKKRVKYHLA